MTVYRRLATVALFILYCWLAYIYPQLDLDSSSVFFNQATRQFFFQDSMLITNLLDVLQASGRILPVLMVALIVAARLSKACARRLPKLKVMVYIFLAMVIAPGVVVNALKAHYGRARPVQVEQFGGNAKFTPALVVSGECRRNCSFVSGDAAIGFIPLAVALLAHRNRRRYINLSLVFGIAIALTKVMQGRHFLSDVVVASVLTIGLNYELYLAMIKSGSATDLSSS